MNNSKTQQPFRAVLLDMDGVLADVEHSYRECIIQTAKQVFEVDVSPEDINVCKALGNANNDWDVTYRLGLAKKMLLEGKVSGSMEKALQKVGSMEQKDDRVYGTVRFCCVPSFRDRLLDNE